MEVDRLELLIEGQAQGATKALESVVLNLGKVKTALNTTTSSVKVGTINIAEMTTQFGNLANAQNRVTRNTNSLISQLSKLALAFFALRRVMRFGWRALTSSMDFEETVNLFQTVFKKLGLDAGKEFEFAFLERATKFNEHLTTALHLDPNVVMNYQARFAQMADSMNVLEESSFNISSALTMLSADVSSLFNIEFETAMKKLQSGLAGQIRPLRDLGVDISKTSLMQTAWNYGITDSIEKMSAAAKVQLRFLAMIQQLRVAMGDMARTIESPANQLRILRQQWDLFTRSLGNIFLPIAVKVMPYLNAMVIVLRRLAQTLAELVGWEFPDWTGVEIYRGALGDITDEAEEATDAVKKLRNAIFGFDEINVFLRPSKGAGETPVDSGYAILDKAIADEYEGYLQKFNEEVSKMKDTAGEIADKMETPFRNALKLVGVIAAGLLGWKVSTGLLTFVAGLSQISLGQGAVGGLAATLGISSGVLAGILSTVTLIVGRFAHLVITSKKFRDGLALIWDSIKTGINRVKKLASKIYGLLPEDVRIAISEFFASLSKQFDYLDLDLADLAITIAGIALLFTPAAPFGAVLLAFEALTVLVRGIGSDTDAMKLKFEEWGDKINDVLDTVLAPFKEFWDDHAEQFFPMMEKAEEVWDKYTNLLGLVSKKVGETVATIIDAMEWLWKKTEFQRMLFTLGWKVTWEIIKGIFNTAIDIVINLFDGLLSILSGLLDVFTGIFTGDWELAWDGIKEIVRGAGNAIIGTINVIIGAVEGMINAIGRAINSIPSYTIPDYVPVLGGKTFGFPTMSTVTLPRVPEIPKFKLGGLPNHGELFIANEAGPELVGRIGNRSAVANQDQIVDALSQGLAQTLSGVVGQGGGDMTFQFIFGTDKLYETVVTEAQRRRERSGKTIIHVGV